MKARLSPARQLGTLSLVSLLLGVIWLTAGQTAPRAPSEGGRSADSWPQLPTPSYAIQAFMWWRPDVAYRDIELVQTLGFGWVKQGFAWRDIEGIKKGAYNWYFPDLIVNLAAQAGVQLLVRIDHEPLWAHATEQQGDPGGPLKDVTDLTDFCYALAHRFRGRIGAYQVWNEPNLSREWGGQTPNAREYVALLRACYSGIKLADPEAIVISAGLAPTGLGPPTAVPDEQFLQDLYDAGAAPYFDVLGLNAPGYKAPPEVSPDEAADPDQGWGGHRTFAFRHVEDMRQIMVANGDAGKQVAILEMGWTTDPRPDSPYHWHAVAEEQQADYLVRAFRYAKEHWPWVGLISAIYIAHYDWTPENEEYWWAITYPDFPETRVRPAFGALRAMEK